MWISYRRCHSRSDAQLSPEVVSGVYFVLGWDLEFGLLYKDKLKRENFPVQNLGRGAVTRFSTSMGHLANNVHAIGCKFNNFIYLYFVVFLYCRLMDFYLLVGVLNLNQFQMEMAEQPRVLAAHIRKIGGVQSLDCGMKNLVPGQARPRRTLCQPGLSMTMWCPIWRTSDVEPQESEQEMLSQKRRLLKWLSIRSGVLGPYFIRGLRLRPLLKH